ncbi:GntR family transcriptional regulator [Sphingomonas sp. BIUV-7]|uniref:GntR family transcriptional regulator n=1 Tax=Sphingomonas natans TaxID=3063330 RepID=A0ABT8Y7S8_9SPHN|nr:GntR family transcriptional regulator [Sphingomonas sp. BIUV-7]MDO6414363.1 GntR family transcriptional regulator [Sphingomonas sp. BIUV-7]
MTKKTAIAYLFLRRKILDLAIKPGSQLRVGQIQDRLDMTRPPVLDALIWLQAEDYLQNDHNQAFFVKDWGADEIKQTYELRAMFAEHAASCWSQRADDQSIANLQKAIFAAEGTLDAELFDPEELTLSFRAFDRTLIDLQELTLLAKLHRQVTPPAQFRRTMRMLNKDNFAEALLGRQRLLEAIIRRDVAWARSIARAMMLFLQHRHLDGLAANQDRFMDDWLTAADLPSIHADVVWGDGRPDLENSTLATLRPKAF